jgi:hypothetical protein
MAVSKRLRYEVLKRDGNKCRYCGAEAEDSPLQIDHVVPKALGGQDESSNLVAACRDCNAGKSSVPADAPLVADVADKALAWAEAMRIVAEERAVTRAQSQKHYAKFRKEWNGWKDWRGNTEPLPGGWKSSVDQMLNAGLDMVDLLELVDVAIGAKAKDTWRYFCGCCWKRLTQMQERAAEVIRATSPTPEESAPPYTNTPLTVTGMPTIWTTEDVEDYYSQNLSYAEEWCKETDFEIISCRHIASGGGHCEDALCMVEYASSLHWVAQVREDQYRRNAAELKELVSG